MTRASISVLFDHQIFDLQPVGGVSRSFSRCARYLKNEVRDIDPWVGCLISRNQHLRQDLARFKRTHPLSLISRKSTRIINRALTRYLRSRADILHPTWYLPELLPKIPNRPLVATIHDMIPELFPEHFPSGNPHHAKQEYCRSADILICVSEQTRSDLIRLYDIPKQRTRVVYHGIDLAEERCDVIRPQNAPTRYILFVGKRSGYKNFTVALSAFEKLHRRFPDLHLVTIGGGPFSPDERENIATRNLGRFVHNFAATDPELRGWYRNAGVFVYPSRYEGFGIPILEAFAQGCPVALARASCFPEVAEEAALYFEPHDVDSCAEALTRALEERSDHRVKLGYQRCRDFTWTRASQALADVYRDLV